MSRNIIECICTLLAVFCASQIANAQQALTYADCVVHDVPALEAAITSAYDALEGGPRPAVMLDEWMWNGEFDVTHRVIVSYPDYAALAAFRQRLLSTPAAAAALNSFEFATECRTDGLSVFRGAWGNPEAEPVFWQVYGISASDGAAYAAALGELAEAQSDGALVTVLFENRAGISDDTHHVALGAPTFAGLNESLDTLFASDDFADFNDEVSSIRSVTWRAQARRMRVWSPDGN